MNVPHFLYNGHLKDTKATELYQASLQSYKLTVVTRASKRTSFSRVHRHDKNFVVWNGQFHAAAFISLLASDHRQVEGGAFDLARPQQRIITSSNKARSSQTWNTFFVLDAKNEIGIRIMVISVQGMWVTKKKLRNSKAHSAPWRNSKVLTESHSFWGELHKMFFFPQLWF